jgi:hypothetical protein
VEEAYDVVDEQVKPVAGPLFPQLQKDHRLLELVEYMPQVQVVGVEDEVALLE